MNHLLELLPGSTVQRGSLREILRPNIT
jgi:hypothetical protein